MVETDYVPEKPRSKVMLLIAKFCYVKCQIFMVPYFVNAVEAVRCNLIYYSC